MTTLEGDQRNPASYRDPCGYVVHLNNECYRRILPSYFPQYQTLMESGLYEALVQEKLLVPHQEIENTSESILIKPEQIEFFSFPYEWSFDQYRDAALLTLRVQRIALDFGMTLKDATPYNVTFHRGHATFIDTLSFDHYTDGQPWTAYGEFCTQFLAPIALMRYCGEDMRMLWLHFARGIPCSLASRLLPWRTRLIPLTFAHIHLLAKYERRYEMSASSSQEVKVAKSSLFRTIDHMSAGMSSWTSVSDTVWSNYYDKTNYDATGLKEKADLVRQWVQESEAKRIWDVGANDGRMSRSLAEDCQLVLCTDIDDVAVSANYAALQKEGIDNALPLVADFTMPSPGLGLDNEERRPFNDRVQELKLDLVLALAFIHHVTLSNNVPFDVSAKAFAQHAPWLILEFPGRNDSWVQHMLEGKGQARPQFETYGAEAFEKAYLKVYDITAKKQINGTERCMYLLSRR